MDLVQRIDAPFAWIVGTSDGSTSYVLTRWVFLRGLGVVYLIAFVSLWVQVKGLLGSQGILPATQYLETVRGYVGGERYRLVPTLFWLNASDAALVSACAAGTLAAVLLICNIAPVPSLIALWMLYLSLVSVGRDFFAFQWDVLLLEAGLLAIFFAPLGVLPGRAVSGPVNVVVLFLLWWLLFRLTFQSGLVKLMWGDPTWRDLTALDFHFYTQPLPTWTAWYAHQVPHATKRGLVLVMYLLELGAPLLMFGSRPMRLVGCAGVIAMQLLILGTGNYNFFNLLTIVLALLLIDDAIWLRVLPGPLGNAVPVPGVARDARPSIIHVVAVVVLVVSVAKFWQNLSPRTGLPAPLRRVLAWCDPWRSINSYGLFRVMTTSRLEIVVEGSNDLRTWQTYEFKYKPGDVSRRPGFVAPHQPRLDWQMWFAALSRADVTPWFERFLVRLLEGSRPVLDLLARNPFPDRPPRYVRALLYDYRFTTPAERSSAGAWWARTPAGVYAPVASLLADGVPAP